MFYEGYKRKLKSNIRIDNEDYIRIESKNSLTNLNGFGLVF